MIPPTCFPICLISSSEQPFKMGVAATEGQRHMMETLESAELMHLVAITTPFLDTL